MATKNSKTISTNTSISYQDEKGNIIFMEDELAQGGEGVVYFIKGNPNLVAKIYKSEVLKKHDKGEKIKAMCSLYDDEIAKFSALPQTTLYNSKGKVVGFIMEKISKDFKEIHNLYGITSKRKKFDFSDFGFSVHAAKNLAIAVDILHKRNIVIGDINQGNILVNNQAMIKLIDCDSYQVENKGNFYLCEVGVPEYTSPELQGQSFSGIKRTVNHDGFGLAVMIFKILMFGRHPYSGVGAPHEIEQAIINGYYCFSKNSVYTTKIYSKLFSAIFDDKIKELFERAFSKKQNIIRPLAEDWIEALDDFEKKLERCKQNQKHAYNPRYGKCIWCELDNMGFSPYDNKKNIKKQKYIHTQTPYLNSLNLQNNNFSQFQQSQNLYPNQNNNININYLKQHIRELLIIAYVIFAFIIGITILNSNKEGQKYENTVKEPSLMDNIQNEDPKNSTNNKKNATQENNEELYKSTNFKNYISYLEESIKFNWNPPNISYYAKVVTTLRIGKNGQLLDCKIKYSSGSDELDSSAILAINEAAPFRSLPIEFKGSSIDVDYTFSYNPNDAKTRPQKTSNINETDRKKQQNNSNKKNTIDSSNNQITNTSKTQKNKANSQQLPLKPKSDLEETADVFFN